MFAIQMTTSAALPGGPARPAGGAHARSAREQPGALEVRIPDDGLASLEEASVACQGDGTAGLPWVWDRVVLVVGRVLMVADGVAAGQSDGVGGAGVRC